MSESPQISAEVRESPIDLAAESAGIQHAADGIAGASVCFSGAVRGGDVLALTLEHYPGMTEKALQRIAESAAQRWPLLAARIVHRAGRMLPGEIIVFAGVCAAHRAPAFAACSYIADFLKTRAPFWKKEETAQGERWVEARVEDTRAIEEWEKGAPANG